MPLPVIGSAASAASYIASIRSFDAWARPRPFLERVSKYSCIRSEGGKELAGRVCRFCGRFRPFTFLADSLGAPQGLCSDFLLSTTSPLRWKRSDVPGVECCGGGQHQADATGDNGIILAASPLTMAQSLSAHAL